MIYPTQMYVYYLDKVTCLKGLRNGSGRKTRGSQPSGLFHSHKRTFATDTSGIAKVSHQSLVRLIQLGNF